MEPTRCQECPTRRLCLAAGLEGEALTALSRCVFPGAPVQRGEALYRAGEPASGVYVVRSGSFKTVVLSNDGEEHVTGFHYPGDIIGLSGQAHGTFRDSATALETGTACHLPVEEMPRLWEAGGGASFMRLVGAREQLDTQGHTNLSRSAADARVAGFLVSLGARMRRRGRSEAVLPLAMSRTDLANHLGMTLECLSRVLARLASAGLITATRTSISQNDPDRLMDLAGHPDP